MPKRVPTPPLDDDSKFLIVNYPYPLHVNVNIASERYEFAHWIVACIGQQCQTNFIAVYHKPSAPNMVIIEILKGCPQINAILGSHKWCEFLKQPESQEIGMESRIYYCRYSTGREVQKYGWKRLDVDERWFNTFDPINGPFITNPYPLASFCEVPQETQVDYRLCRPLPIEIFPRPKPTRTNKQPIVPGSEAYVRIKQTGGQPIASPTPTRQGPKSWASVLTGRTPQGTTDAEWRKTAPNTAYTGPSTVVSPTDDDNSFDSNIAIEAPPGLGPPGLSVNPSQASLEWEFESSYSAASSDSTLEVITSGLEAVAIMDYTSKCDEQAAQPIKEDYWADRPVRPTDWDKPICPVHQVFCRTGICKVMDEIERKKKREAATRAQQSDRENWRTRSNGNRDVGRNNGDGWEVAKPKGRGRGRGSGRGQARGQRARGRVGGWV